MQDSLSSFPDLVVADWSFLNENSSRTKCAKCNRSRKYYCYSCCIALPHLQDKLPSVKLPSKVDIIKHPGELDGKSTAPHALILAPDDVTIHTYPCIPDYDPDKVIVVFPSENSMTLKELKSLETVDIKLENKKKDSITLSKNHSITNDEVVLDASVISTSSGKSDNLDKTCNSPSHNVTNGDSAFEIASKCTQDQPLNDTVEKLQSNSLPDLKRKRELDGEEEEGSDLCEHLSLKHQKTSLTNCPIERVVFIDCTWNQTRIIASDERLEGLKKIELKSELSKFWRTQEKIPKTYLSTIEAIYYFFKEFHSIFVDPVYRNEYDNLMFFFCFMYEKINGHNKQSQEK